MIASPSQVGEYTAAYRAQLDQLRTAVAAATRQRFDYHVFNGDWHDAGMTRFRAAAAPLVTGGQRWAVSLTQAYFGLVGAAEAGTAAPVRVLDQAALVGQRGGAPLAEVYGRPFFQLWIDLHDGREFMEAAAAAQATLEREVTTDLTLASRGTAGLLVSADPRVVGWWREASPTACGFCRVLATRLYYRDVLMSIHPHCTCTQRPAYSAEVRPTRTGHGALTRDYGAVIDEASVRRAYPELTEEHP